MRIILHEHANRCQFLDDRGRDISVELALRRVEIICGINEMTRVTMTFAPDSDLSKLHLRDAIIDVPNESITVKLERSDGVAT